VGAFFCGAASVLDRGELARGVAIRSESDLDPQSCVV